MYRGYPLVVFGNHWEVKGLPMLKLNAPRGAKMPTVLRNRIDELRAENPHLDFCAGRRFQQRL